MSFTSSSLQTDAVIGFAQDVYTVEESDLSLTVCIESRVELERIVNVDIALVNGSAEGRFSVPFFLLLYCWIFNNTGDVDFHIASNASTVAFTANETMHCIDISIEADGVLEENEMFSVMLSTTEERVNLAPELANITIIDDDSKLCNYTHPLIVNEFLQIFLLGLRKMQFSLLMSLHHKLKCVLSCPTQIFFNGS